MAEEEPKLHIDTDWKTQAQQEKQRLAEQSKAGKPAGAEAPGAGEPGEQTQAQAQSDASGRIPPANFETLVSTLATQALFAMGAIADPRTGQPHQDLDLARHHIDMIGVIEEKTRGNLSDQENELLSGTLYELRSRYVQLANAARTK